MTDILVVSYPKAGGTWLCRLLGDILNSPVGAIYKAANNKAICTEGQGRPGGHYIGHGHPVPSIAGHRLVPDTHLYLNLSYLKDEKIVLLTRDPRDICVSAMHHWGMDSIHQAIECVGEGKWPLPHGGGFVPFYEKWKQAEKPLMNIQHTSYELLYSKPVHTLERMYYGFNNLPVPNKEIRQAIERQSFANRKKWTQQHGDNLNYGKDWQLRFLRKGVVGDWVNHFDDRAIEMAERYFEGWI